MCVREIERQYLKCTASRMESKNHRLVLTHRTCGVRSNDTRSFYASLICVSCIAEVDVLYNLGSFDNG